MKKLVQMQFSRKELRRGKRILASIILPMLIFQMTSMNFVTISLMRTSADDAAVVQDAPKVEVSAVEEKGTEEAPKVEEKKIDASKDEIAPVTEAVPVDEVAVPLPIPTPEPTVSPTESVVSISDPIIPTVNSQKESVLPVAPLDETVPVEKECLDGKVEAKNSTQEDWSIDEKKGIAETKRVVKLGVKYVFPLEEKTTVTFSCLPKDLTKRAALKIEKIDASKINLPDGMKFAGGFAYDITTGMNNGDFKYEITLPKIEDIETQVFYIEKSAEEVKKEEIKINDIKEIGKEKIEQEKETVRISELDHFTVFGLVGGNMVAASIFSDNFNDNSIDSSKWTTAGTSVIEQNGVMNVNRDATDAGGVIWSKWIPVNGTQLITVSRRTIQHHSDNVYSGTFRFLFDTNGDGEDDFYFGIDYADNYYTNGSGLCARYGFFLVPDSQGWWGGSYACAKTVSDKMTAIWDEWFTETYIYNPISGELTYSAVSDDNMTHNTASINVGTLPNYSSYQMQLSSDAWGWFTGHYDHFDDISVVQSDEVFQCSDGIDNNGDGMIDIDDTGCHSDENAGNPSSYNPNDNDEKKIHINQAPVITLLGDNPITISRGDVFSDPGANASDEEDGDITSNISVLGEVDTSIVGTVSLTYSVTDSNGVEGVMKRDVIVLEKLPQCSDGIDNDGDGLVDANDPGCASSIDNDEANLPAEYITYYFSGQLNDDPHNMYNDFGTIPDGTLFCGSFSYDVNQSLNTPLFPYRGDYKCKNVSVTIGGETVTNAGTGLIYVYDHDSGGGYPTENSYDDTGSSVDSFGLDSSMLGKLGGIDLTGLWIDLQDLSGTVFSSPAIPGANLSLSGFSIGAGTYLQLQSAHYLDSQWHFLTVRGNLTALSTTPIQCLENHRPIITLLGDNPLAISQGDVFSDPGATASDEEDGDITSEIVANGTVDTSEAGTYIISYDVKDSKLLAAETKTRTVNVVAKIDPNNIPPSINLNGQSVIYIAVGKNYTDSGATASDVGDGDLTPNIVTTGLDEVSTTVPATYRITYSVVDSQGAPAETKFRDVVVGNYAMPNSLPQITWVNEPGFEDGVNPSDLFVGETITAKLIYTDADNNRPQVYMWAIEGRNGNYGNELQSDPAAPLYLRDHNYMNGEQLMMSYIENYETQFGYKFLISDFVNSNFYFPSNTSHLTVHDSVDDYVPTDGTLVIRDDVIGGDCTQIGTWNASAKTCALTQDYVGKIFVASDDIIFDGTDHTLASQMSCEGVASNLESILSSNRTKNVEVKNVIFKKCGYYAMDIQFSSEWNVHNNTFDRVDDNAISPYGINLAGNNNLCPNEGHRIHNNTFINNGGVGLHTIDTKDLSVIGNSFQGTDQSLSLDGQIGNLTIEDNEFSDVKYAILASVTTWENYEGHAYIRRNTIHRAEENGIKISGFKNSEISNNHLSDDDLNFGRLMHLSGMDDSTISDNTVEKFMHGGIYLEGNGNSIQNNTITMSDNGGEDGIETQGSFNEIKNNTIESGHEDHGGIIISGTETTIKDNKINNTADFAIIAHGDSHSVSGNYGKCDSGISLQSVENADIRSNYFTGVVNSGVSLENANNNYLYDNQLLGSSGWGRGISILNSNNNTFDSHTVENVTDGVWIENSKNNTITNNTIRYSYLHPLNIVMNISNEINIANTIKHNNFIQAGQMPYAWMNGGILLSDLGFGTWSGGNYWSAYDTMAEGCVDANNDKFCDTPYYFDPNFNNTVGDMKPYVRENGWETNTPSNNAPIITVNPEIVYQPVSVPFTVANKMDGVTASDPDVARDQGDIYIKDRIVVTGEVNHMQPGEYALFYNVTDSHGLAAIQKTRTVIIQAEPILTVIAPTNLVASYDLVNNSIVNTWEWNGVQSNSDGFRVYRKMNSGVYSLLSAVANNIRTYQDINITAGATYCYQILAYKGSIESSLSNEQCQTIEETTPNSTKFALNDRTRVFDGPVNVRQSAGGTILGTQATNALGTIIGGPMQINGHWWWNIDYDNGVDGWSAEDFLEKYVDAPPAENQAPTLSFPSSEEYGDGIYPNTGARDTTQFTFKVIYADPNNDTPSDVTLHYKGENWADWSTRTMTRDDSGTGDLHDGIYNSEGEMFTFTGIFDQENTYEYYFTTDDGHGKQFRLLESSNLSFNVTDQSQLPVLEFIENTCSVEQNCPYADGVEPNKGYADETERTFKIKYNDEKGNAPDFVNVVIGSGRIDKLDTETLGVAMAGGGNESITFNINSSLGCGNVGKINGYDDNIIGVGLLNQGRCSAPIMGFSKDEKVNIDITKNSEQKISFDVIIPASDSGGNVNVYAEAFDAVDKLVADNQLTIQSHKSLIDNSPILQTLSLSTVAGIKRIKISIKDAQREGIYIGKFTIEPIVLNMVATNPYSPTSADFKTGVVYQTRKKLPLGDFQFHFETAYGNINVPVQKPFGFTNLVRSGYDNILFVPGIKASELYIDGDGSFDSSVWPPKYNDLHLPDSQNLDLPWLTLNSDGKTKEPIYSKNIISDAFVYGDVYGKFEDYLNSLKAINLITDWKSLPYDWRLDFDDILEKGFETGSAGYIDHSSSLPINKKPLIESRLLDLQDTSRTGNTIIVAHSMGGLIGKRFIKKLENGTNADKKILTHISNLILVASPQLGTPSAMTEIMHGEPIKPWMDLRNTFMYDNRSYIDIARYSKSAYSLLPSEQYTTAVKNYFNIGFAQPTQTVATNLVEFDSSLALLGLQSEQAAGQWSMKYHSSQISDYNTLRIFLEGSDEKAFRVDNPKNMNNLSMPLRLNQGALDRQNMIHGILPNIINNQIDYKETPNTVHITQIAGVGIPTTRGLRYFSEQVLKWFSPSEAHNFCEINKCDQEYKDGEVSYQELRKADMMTNDGDGTVVAPSAVFMNVPTAFVNLGEYSKDNSNKYIHGNIMGVKPVQEEIRNLLMRRPLNYDLDYVSKDRPNGLDKMYLSVFSPVTLGAYDEQGRFTGLKIAEDGSEMRYEEIPGSAYFINGDGKYLSLNPNLKYRIVMDGLGNGSFTLFGEEQINGEIKKQIAFHDVPVSAETAAEMTIDTLENTATLKIDKENDGIIDYSLDAIESFHDITSPSTIINLSGLKQHDDYIDDVIVNFDSKDNDGGSGVKKTEYSLDGGVAWIEYKDPFTVSGVGDHTVKYRSEDWFGNLEETKSETFSIVKDDDDNNKDNNKKKKAVILATNGASSDSGMTQSETVEQGGENNSGGDVISQNVENNQPKTENKSFGERVLGENNGTSFWKSCWVWLAIVLLGGGLVFFWRRYRMSRIKGV